MATSDKSSSPFAALAGLRDSLPRGPEAPAPAPAGPSQAAPVAPLSGKLVVAHSRKGRRGKTVTTVAGVRGGEAVLTDLAGALRKALGCGAVVEGALIVVQGEQVARVRAFLEARGARQVVLGSKK